MVVTAVGMAAGPARADATLEVEAGYADGNFLPGRQIPVRVRIAADRLVKGTLQVGLKVPGAEVFTVSVPVEVSGGTSKEVLVALNTWAGLDRAEVVASLGDADLTGTADIHFSGNTELVGLLPELVDRAPLALPLVADLGTAQLSLLDDAELTTPGALDPLGTIVASPEGVGELTEGARLNLLTWLDRGGRLVVDSQPGDRIGGLPDAWQPGDTTRVAAGRGEVRFSSGTASAGRWAEVIEPTPMVLPGDLTPRSFWGVETVADAVGRDGGLRIPTVGWLLAFLVIYVLAVGPVAFLVLRRRGRVNWTWFAVVSLAAVFAAGAFVVGNDLRSGSEVSHGSVVHTGPAGARASSYVGLVSRSGADGRAEFPEGWSASGMINVLGDPRVLVADPFADQRSLEPSPADVSLGRNGTLGEIQLDPGGFGMVTGWGALEPTEGLEVTAVANSDGSVSGTVHNGSAFTLRQVMVVVGMRSWGAAEALAPSETVEWRVPPGDGFELANGPTEQPWREATSFSAEGPSRNSPINFALWEAAVLQAADPYPTGMVVAAGWTKEWIPPIDSDGPIEAGRTVFKAEAAVTAAAGTAPAAAVRRDYLRGSRATPVDDDRLADVKDRLSDDWGVDLVAGVLRFTLPTTAGADPGLQLQVSMPGTVVAADVWDGASWVALERHRGPNGPVLDDAELPAGFDPYNSEPWNVADVPPSAVRDGLVYLRVHMADTSGDSGPGIGVPTLGQAA